MELNIPSYNSLLPRDRMIRAIQDLYRLMEEYDPSSIPTALSQLTDDATHRLVTDTEKATWNAKAEVGESTDPKTADTVYGAKAFATDADQTNAYFQQNLAVITALSEDPNAGVTIVTTNPEWKLVYTDAKNRILFGKRQDNTWYFAIDLDTILDAIIDGYTNP